MALGRQRDRQAEMLVTWSELPRSPGHVFYDRLQAILIAAGLTTLWKSCAPAPTRLCADDRHCRRAATSACC